MTTSQQVKQIKAFLKGNLESYLDLLRQMVEINSFTRNAEGVNRLGDLTASAFGELGFSPLRLSSSNASFGRHLILAREGRRGPESPSIAMVSHLDTVFSPEEERRNNFHWRIEGNRIYGPGTVDIKGGTVVIFMVLSALRHLFRDLFEDVSWTILLNSSEEELAVDFGSICRDYIPGNALASLVFEGGRAKKSHFVLVRARKGRFTYQIQSKGRGAHAGSSHAMGANAVIQLSQTLSDVATLTDYEREITFNVGTVAGGTVVNRVPHLAMASGEARAYDEAILDAGIENLLKLSEQTAVVSAKDGYRCEIEINILGKWAPWSPNKSTDRLLQVWQKAGQRLDYRVVGEKRGGLSDGNQTWNFVPTLDGLGPAGRNAHCSERTGDGSKDQEFVWRKSFVPKSLLNVVGIVDLLQASGQRNR